MPLTFATPQTFGPAPAYTRVDIVRILIDYPVPNGTSRTITYFYEARDANNKLVGRKEIAVLATDPAITGDIDYATTYGALRRVGYALAVRAGFATGGTVTS